MTLYREPGNTRQASGNQTQAFWRDSALPFVESRRACHSRACYRPHHHPTYSIGAVDGGTSVFTGAASGPVSLRPGTLVFVPADRVHACNPAPDTAWSYQMLHLDTHWLHGVRHEYTPTCEHGAEPVRIVTEPTMYARFCQLNACLFSRALPSDKEVALIEFVGDYDASQGFCVEMPSVPSDMAQRIQPALECLRMSPAARIALCELAALTHMSRYQLIRAFRAVTGMTPHAWQINQRVNLARKLIQKGDGIAAVAHTLGFADQAHFQRVFKAHAGVTPGQFRA